MRSFRVTVVAAVALATWIACTGDDPAPASQPAGSEGAECNDGQCLPGLSCVSGRCVRIDGSTSPVGPDAGGGTDADPSDAHSAADPVVALAAGQSVNCVLTESGKVKCWGANDRRQLAQSGELRTCAPNATPCSWDPITIGGLGKVKAVAAGNAFVCVIDEDDSVKCWGANDHGQLGHEPSKAGDLKCDTSLAPNIDCNATPRNVEGIGPADRVVALSAGHDHACAVLPNQQVRCWGHDNTGQLGRGTNPSQPFYSWVATKVATGATYTSVSASPGGADDDAGHTCATAAGASMLCWGSNYNGALGSGTSGASFSALPATAQSDLSYIPTQVATGESATCVKRNGRIECWGSPADGLLGIVADAGVKARPIAADASFEDLAGGRSHMCAREPNGTVWCWGVNGLGQLGTGDIETNATCSTYCRPQPKPIPNFSAKRLVVGSNTLALREDGSVWTWGTNAVGLLGHEPGTDGDRATCAIIGAPCRPEPVQIKSLP